MHINNLFFHVHYCKCRQGDASASGRYPGKITRTIQHHELIFVKSGKGSISIGKKSYSIKGGMLFYICPDVLHSIEIGRGEPVHILTVHFSSTHVNFNDGKWEISNEPEILPMRPALELKDYYHVEEIFKKLVDSWNTRQPGYEFITRTLLQQLLIGVYQNIKKQNQNYGISLKIEKIIEYMQQNINHKVTLADLAEMVQLAPTYLSRTFKMATGYSVIEFFNKMKIDKAKELIVEGNIKVKEVAKILGFIDEFYFSRMFKRMEGISPSEYYSKNVHGV